MTTSERRYDIVLFGATGFAGALTAEYLARHAPAGLRWALAGRDAAKLETARANLATIDPALSSLPLLVARLDDAAALKQIAQDAVVIVTTVGPFALHGEPIVAACAAAGTDYVDSTGEPEFVDTTYARHHETAVASGARLVHACGFDSAPHDLGAYYTMLQLPEGVPITMSGYVQVSAAPSGGTFLSVLTGLSRGKANMAAGRERKRLEPIPTDRSVRTPAGKPHRIAVFDGWALPIPLIDAQIVARSARAMPRYGPQFAYSHFAAFTHLRTAVGAVAGVAGLFGVAQIGPARRALAKRLPAGEGPSKRKREQSWFKVTFVGEGGGRRVVTRVSGGDPGYDETAHLLGEAALTLALDRDLLPPASGQMTTVVAMGDVLLERLQRSGMRFETLP